MPSNIRETATVLAATLEEMTTRLARAAERLEKLDQTAERVERRLARGTFQGEPLEMPAPEATVPGKRRTKRDTIAPESHNTLPSTPPGRRPATGSPALACWVGDEGSTATLNAAVERLLRERPLSRAELVAMTGARTNRVAGAIVHLQRHGAPIVNLGTPRLGRWYIVPERK